MRRMVVVLAVLVTLLTAGCASVRSEEGWKTTRNRAYGYSISYPSTWVEVRRTSGHSYPWYPTAVSFEGPDHASVLVDVSDAPLYGDIDTFREKHWVELQFSMNATEVLQFTQPEEERTGEWVRRAYFRHGKYYVQMTLWVPKGTVNRQPYYEIFDRMLRTFRS